MFQIVICVQNNTNKLTFSYKTLVAAQKALDNIWQRIQSTEEIKVTDDYEHIGVFEAGQIACALLVDIEKELQASAEMQIVQQRVNKAFAHRVDSDPELKVLFNRSTIQNAPPGTFGSS